MNRFLKGAMILTLAGIIVKVIGAFSKVLIARILGGEGIGLYMMAYPIYQIIVSISAAGIPVAISIMIAEKLANDDMRGVQQVFSVSLRVLAILGLVFSLALYGSAQWLVDNQIITDPRALIAIQLLSPAIFVVTILSCFRGYFQGFQYMVPTGTSQVFEQIFRVSSMVGLAYYFIDRGLHLAAGGATFATFPGVLAGLLVLIYFYYRQRNVREKMLSQQNPNAICESNGTVVKRLFSLAIPVSMANIMLPMVSLIDTFIVPKRLMDIGYYLNEATTQFGYLTGMATSLIGLPIILTTSLAASLVPAVSEAHTQGDVHRIVKRAETAIKIANMFTIPACIGLCVLATPISQLIYATPHAGPVIAVSHDRYFLDRISDKLFVFEGNGVIRDSVGGYSDYIEHRKQEGQIATPVKQDNKAKTDSWKKNSQTKLKMSYNEKMEFEHIEADIEKLEASLENIESEMAKEASNYSKLNDLIKEKEQLESQLEHKMERWEYLSELDEKIKNQ